LKLLILVAREGFLKEKCGPRAKTFEHHWPRTIVTQDNCHPDNCLLRHIEFSMFIAIKVIWTQQGAVYMSEILKSQMYIAKISSTSDLFKETSTLMLLDGGCRVDQCRIINSSKCYGACVFWGPAVFCVKFAVYCMQGWILEFKCPRQTLRKAALYYIHIIQKFYSLKAR